jgi:hypothetical protein
MRSHVCERREKNGERNEKNKSLKELLNSGGGSFASQHVFSREGRAILTFLLPF